MNGGYEDAATLWRALGCQLRAAREAAGLSQRQLGAQVGRGRATVAHVEAGRQRAKSAVWQAADEACGAEGALLVAYDEAQRAATTYRARMRRARRETARLELAALQAQADTGIVPPARDAADSAMGAHGEWEAQLVTVLGWAAKKVDRREFVRILGLLLAAAGALPDAVGLDGDEYERLAMAVAMPGRVDGRVVEDLSTTLAYWRREEDRAGPRAALRAVLALRDVLGGLLDGCRAEQRPDLLAVYSAVCSTAGGHLLDLGDPGRAQRCLDAARAAATEADDPASGAFAACHLSHAAFLADQAAVALDLAAVAQRLSQGDDAHLSALAEQMGAAALAVTGNYGRCMAAYHRARQTLASARAPRPDSGAYWLDAGHLDSQLAGYLLTLGRPAEAAAAASAARASFDHSYTGGLAVLSIRQATAAIRCRRIDEGALILGDAGDLVIRSPSDRMMRQITSARAELRRWQGTEAVRTLDERLSAQGLVIPRTG